MDFSYFVKRIDTGCQVDPEKEAVIFGDRKTSHRQLRDRAYKLANALKNMGLKKGDKVAVFLKNCGEWFDIYFALSCLGAVMVPVNFLLKTKEVEYIVNDSESSLMFAGEDLLQDVNLDWELMPGLREIIGIGAGTPIAPAIAYQTILDGSKTNPPLDEGVVSDDLLVLQYTSGTTGFPKGAMHTHGTLLWNSIHQIGDFEVTNNERYLCVPGLCWVAGMHDITLATLWMGGAVTVAPSGGLKIDALLSLMEKNRTTKVLLVPTILKQLVDYPDVAKFDFGNLDMVLTGAEPVPVTVIKKFNRLLPKTALIQGYGLSEGPSIALYLPKKDATRKIGSAGRPATNCELKIVDAESNTTAPGVKGEILIRSPSTMIGYWNKPDETKAALKDGWLRTGDLAEYDDEGYIYIRGRIKEMYISGGLNVYPAEIENIILGNPDIAEVAVVGIRHAKWGETGCAVVVPKKGCSVNLKEIEVMCKRELAGYKIPRQYLIRNQPLTRTASGKIKKRELIKEEELNGV